MPTGSNDGVISFGFSAVESRALGRNELAQAIMFVVIEKGLVNWREGKFIASNAYALADAMLEARK